MTDQSTAPSFDAMPVDAPRQRPCLRCSTPFPSEWIGERICRRCKNSLAWRTSLPATFSGSR
jgi:hypothetical protein